MRAKIWQRKLVILPPIFGGYSAVMGLADGHFSMFGLGIAVIAQAVTIWLCQDIEEMQKEIIAIQQDHIKLLGER